MKMKKYIMVLLVILIMLAACNGEDVSDTKSEESVLTILQGVDATTLDPIMHTDSPTGTIEYQIFDTLLKRNDNMELVTNIASNYKNLSETKWELTIKDDIYFHDGEKLNVDDVIYSIERILDEKLNSPRRGYYNSIISLEEQADNKLIIETEKANPILLSRLAELRIVPKHYIEEVGNQEFAQNPIGSGPYIFESWVKDEAITLLRNENYWNGLAEVEKVIFKPVPETSSRIMALQAGQAEIITNVPPHQIEELESSSNLEIAKVDSTRFIMLAFTMSNENVKDIKIREAINLAIDKESIINNILSNNATLSTQPVCNFDLGYNPNIKSIEYNQEKAKQLIKESGKEDIELLFYSPTGRYLMDKEVAEAIKASLEEVGIAVKLQFVDWGSYVSSIISGEINADMWLIGWGSSTFDAGTTLKQWLHTSQTMSQYKVSEEKNKLIDDAIELGLSTVDSAEREKIYHEIISDITEDIPFVNLYQQQNIYAKTNEIEWNPRSDEIIDIKNIVVNE